MTKSRKKFTGRLIEPIRITTRQPTLLSSSPEHLADIDKHNKAEFDRAFFESIAKIRDLEAHYGIEKEEDPTVRLLKLVLAMSKDLVPGFRTKNLAFEKDQGRTKSWNVIKYCELLADVEGLKRSKPRSDSEACNILTSTARYRDRWGNLNKRTLENRLIEARDEGKNVALKLGLSTTLGLEGIIGIIIEHFESPKSDREKP